MNTNGRQLINVLEYKERIKAMPDRELAEFTAMQVYETSIICHNHGLRIISLEKRNRKAFGFTGGIGTAIGAAIVVIIEFIRRGW